VLKIWKDHPGGEQRVSGRGVRRGFPTGAKMPSAVTNGGARTALTLAPAPRADPGSPLRHGRAPPASPTRGAAQRDAVCLPSAPVRSHTRPDTYRIRFKYHFLSYFNLNIDMNLNILKYECKINVSDSDSNLNIYSIYRIIFSFF
jgi:hypothetical protein